MAFWKKSSSRQGLTRSLPTSQKSLEEALECKVVGFGQRKRLMTENGNGHR